MRLSCSGISRVSCSCFFLRPILKLVARWWSQVRVGRVLRVGRGRLIEEEKSFRPAFWARSTMCAFFRTTNVLLPLQTLQDCSRRLHTKKERKKTSRQAKTKNEKIVPQNMTLNNSCVCIGAVTTAARLSHTISSNTRNCMLKLLAKKSEPSRVAFLQFDGQKRGISWHISR